MGTAELAWSTARNSGSGERRRRRSGLRTSRPPAPTRNHSDRVAATRLNTARAFLVALTRIADRATLVVDDPAKLERAVSRNPGEKTSSLKTTGQGGRA